MSVGADRAALVAEADDLESAGRTIEAIEALVAANRIERKPGIERRILALRHAAFAQLDRGAGAPTWPPVLDDPFPDASGLPETVPGALSASTVGGAILHHGGLVVRGLLAPSLVPSLIEGIDGAFAGFDAAEAGEPDRSPDPWYVKFKPTAPYSLANRRPWLRSGGAVWVADAPRLAFTILEAFTAASLPQIVAEHFGEPAALSVNKFTLRKVTPEANPTWHQDGAFLGDGVRAVNVWVSLSDCGGDSDTPGLDLLPRRVDELLETGTIGAKVRDSISPTIVDEVAGDTRIVRPTFAAGDALIFDERFLHRTATSPGMTRDRYAIESWFFAPSHFPPGYVPLLV
jgi:hypothetical protein